MQTKPAPVDSHRGIWCRRVSRGITVPERVWSLGVDNATSLRAGVPPLHLGWRLVRKKKKNHWINPKGKQIYPCIYVWNNVETWLSQARSECILTSRMSLVGLFYLFCCVMKSRLCWNVAYLVPSPVLKGPTRLLLHMWLFIGIQLFNGRYILLTRSTTVSLFSLVIDAIESSK